MGVAQDGTQPPDGLGAVPRTEFGELAERKGVFEPLRQRVVSDSPEFRRGQCLELWSEPSKGPCRPQHGVRVQGRFCRGSGEMCDRLVVELAAETGECLGTLDPFGGNQVGLGQHGAHMSSGRLSVPRPHPGQRPHGFNPLEGMQAPVGHQPGQAIDDLGELLGPERGEPDRGILAARHRAGTAPQHLAEHLCATVVELGADLHQAGGQFDQFGSGRLWIVKIRRERSNGQLPCGDVRSSSDRRVPSVDRVRQRLVRPYRTAPARRRRAAAPRWALSCPRWQCATAGLDISRSLLEQAVRSAVSLGKIALHGESPTCRID